VFTSVAVTVAAEIDAPVLSITVPERALDVPLCARACGVEHIGRTRTARSSEKNLFKLMFRYT
jgi:hypothetical protein